MPRRPRKSPDAGATSGRPSYISLNTSLPMWIYDLQTLRILAVNPAGLKLSGYTRDEFLRRRVTDLWASPGAVDETLHSAASVAALPFSVTRRYRRKNGTLFEARIVAHPLMFRNRSAVLAMAQDVIDLARPGEQLEDTSSHGAGPAEPHPHHAGRTHDEIIAQPRARTGSRPIPTPADASRAAAARHPGRALDDALAAALHALPDGARQLVRVLDIEEVDMEVEEHLAQVGRLSVRLAAAASVPAARQRALAQAALLHDTGKLGLSRSLLRKRGALSSDDRAQLVQHVDKGVALLRALDVDETVVDIVAAHHERWDGTGYPRSLAGEAILVEARILAIADSFDAMTSDRVYQRARTFDEALRELRREAGAQFDPRLIDRFLSLLQETRPAADR